MRRSSRFAALTLALLAAGCVTQRVPAEVGGRQPGLAPALAVERFLQAANTIGQSLDATMGADADVTQLESELNTMARLFGTPEGSVLKLYPRDEVEQRMYALASILKHDDYSIEGQRLVPGRTGEAVEVIVRMRQRSRSVAVPFTVVRAEDGWLVERIDVERITAGR